MRFIITTHRQLDGVALSLVGQWGGVRYHDDASAERAARGNAGDARFTIERERA